MGPTPYSVLNENRKTNAKLSVRLFVRNVTQECRSLLSMMLDPSESLRPSAETCLRHSWFSDDRPDLQNMLILNRNYQAIQRLFLQQENHRNLDEYLAAVLNSSKASESLLDKQL